MVSVSTTPQVVFVQHSCQASRLDSRSSFCSNPPGFLKDMEDRFMTPSRLLKFAALVVVLGIVFLMGAKHGKDSVAASPCPAQPACDEVTNAVYSLKDLGGDAEFGKWVVETIETVIEPGSWCDGDFVLHDKGFMRYNPQ